MLRRIGQRLLTAVFLALSAAPAGAASDCVVHLLDPSGGAERREPCGAPLERGTFLAWIEQGNSISWPARVVIDADTGSLDLPLVPAATLTIAGVNELTAPPSLRLVHVGEKGASFFARDFRNVRDGQRIQVPAARYVAMFFDQRGDAISIAEPMRITAAQTATLAPTRPESGANVLAILQLPETAQPAQDDPALFVDGQAPDYSFDSGHERVALWYAVEPGRTQLHLESKSLALTPIDLRLAEHGVHTARAEVRFLPALTASVTLDTREVAEPPKLTLRVTTENDERVLHEAPIAPGATVRVEKLPRELLVASLHVAGWTLSRSIDLTPGEDASVDFQVEPLEIHGAVTRGGKPARAKLTFRGGGETASVTTNEAGEYEVLLWKPGRYEIDVAPTATTTSLNELYLIERSQRIDIDVPDTHSTVRVTNAETRQPIPRARVGVRNVWSDAGGRRTTMRDLTTDDAGVVDMPPLRNGSVTVYASAEGFEQTTPVTFEAGATAVPPLVEVRLQPHGPGSTIHLFLPDGRPAAGAELMAITNGRSIWSGTAGAEGTVTVPDVAAGALVLVRHRDTGTIARPFVKSTESVRWTLPPAAPPLLVKGERGGEPARQAHVTLWLDGVALSGEALAFAARTTPYTDGAGIWIGSNLPPSPARVLLTTGNTPRSPQSDEALAATIVFPWPAANVIQPVD